MHLLPEVNLQGVSWHQHKHILAFISGPNQVTIRDYDDPGISLDFLSVWHDYISFCYLSFLMTFPVVNWTNYVWIIFEIDCYRITVTVEMDWASFHQCDCYRKTVSVEMSMYFLSILLLIERLMILSEGKEPSILHGDFQREVKVVEWRPNSGRTLSVACRWESWSFSLMKLPFFHVLCLLIHVWFNPVIGFAILQGWSLHMGRFISWQSSICQVWGCPFCGLHFQGLWHEMDTDGFS